MTALGARLVAFSQVALCDDAQHEVVLVTDGQRAYVYPLDDQTQVWGDPTVSRVGVTLDADCPAAQRVSGERCAGRLSWRIDSEGAWGADADAIRLLTAYGTGVEQ